MPKDPKTPGPEAADQPASDDADDPAPESDAAGVTKPWRDEAPDPKKTAKIAQKAAQLAEKHVEDDQDKAAVEAPRPVVDAKGLRVAIGVDVGGSGIKAAAVNLDTGELISPRHRVPTPQPSAACAVVTSELRAMVRACASDTLILAGAAGAVM